jgi:hypothetical protein
MSVIANPPFPSYFDSDGSPLEDGYIYFGAANQNPETNPITVYWDEALTQPVLQPVRTSNGFVTRAGTPSNIFVPGTYSISVKSKTGRLVYSAPQLPIVADTIIGDLNIQTGVPNQIRIGADSYATTLTNNVTKAGTISVPHYQLAQSQVGVISGVSTSTDNVVEIGGNAGVLNSATQIRFYTAPTNVSGIGTEKARIDAGGSLQLYPGAGGGLFVDGAAGGNRNVGYRTAGSNRWIAATNSTAESGSNAGSDFNLWRYSDAGAFLGTALSAIRSSGFIGINTGSPQQALHVTRAGSVYAMLENTTDSLQLLLGATGGSGNAIYSRTVAGGASPLYFFVGASNAGGFNSAGNLGLGTIPSNWVTGATTAIQLPRGSLSSSGSGPNDHIALAANAFNSGSNDPGATTWSYVAAGTAALYEQRGGWHRWYRAGSGAAGSAITWSAGMVMDSLGFIGIGTQLPQVGLQLGGDSTYRELRLRRSINDASAQALVLYKTRGTESSPVIVNPGDTTGTLIFAAYDGASAIQTASISSNVFSGSTPALNDIEGVLVFSTNRGAAAATEAARINSVGNVGIGTTTPEEIAGYKTLETSGTTGGIFQATNGTQKAALYVNATAGYVGTRSNHPMQFVTNASPRMSLDTVGNLTPAADNTQDLGSSANRWQQLHAAEVVSSSYNGGQLAGMRNKIINGRMEIAQRGTSFPAVASGAYTLDRWVIGNTSSAVATIALANDVATAQLPENLRLTVTTADAAIAATDAMAIDQRIEGYNIRDLVGKTFTLSFWVKSPKTGTHCVAFRNTGFDRTYVATYTVNAANTWEFKSVTVSGGLITAGTWDYATGAGLIVTFTLAAGSNFHTTAGAWQTGAFIATSAQVNCVDTIGNVFSFTGVQLEVGSVPAPFENRAYGVELALCQRYYQTGYTLFTAYQSAGSDLAVTSAFVVTPRTSPVVTPTAVGTNFNHGTIFAGPLGPAGGVPYGAVVYASATATGSTRIEASYTVAAEL